MDVRVHTLPLHTYAIWHIECDKTINYLRYVCRYILLPHFHAWFSFFSSACQPIYGRTSTTYICSQLLNAYWSTKFHHLEDNHVQSVSHLRWRIFDVHFSTKDNTLFLTLEMHISYHSQITYFYHTWFTIRIVHLINLHLRIILIRIIWIGNCLVIQMYQIKWWFICYLVLTPLHLFYKFGWLNYL